MKTLQTIVLLTFSLMPICSVPAEETTIVEGRVVASATKSPIGAFTVKVFATGTDSSPTDPAAKAKALAQTLTRVDGSYSLPIAANLKQVILRFEKLSYFSVPPEQSIQLISPKTKVPDVVAVEYTYGQNVSAHDLREALSIRETSIKAILADLPPQERESARNKLIESDLDSLRKSKVEPATILEIKKQFLPR
jgi:hypothetical protein